jgi:hypothetical protein
MDTALLVVMPGKNILKLYEISEKMLKLSATAESHSFLYGILAVMY